MGQAKNKLAVAGEIVKFDFSAPDFHVTRGDRELMAKTEDGQVDESLVLPRVGKYTVIALVKAAFPNGVDRRDGQVWGEWLKVADDDGPAVVEVTRGQVDWFLKNGGGESVKVPTGMAQWREAVLDYARRVLES